MTEICIYKSNYAADTIYGMLRRVEVESERYCVTTVKRQSTVRWLALLTKYKEQDKICIYMSQASSYSSICTVPSQLNIPSSISCTVSLFGSQYVLCPGILCECLNWVWGCISRNPHLSRSHGQRRPCLRRFCDDPIRLSKIPDGFFQLEIPTFFKICLPGLSCSIGFQTPKIHQQLIHRSPHQCSTSTHTEGTPPQTAILCSVLFCWSAAGIPLKLSVLLSTNSRNINAMAPQIQTPITFV